MRRDKSVELPQRQTTSQSISACCTRELTLGELKEDKLVLLELLSLGKSLLVLVRSRESLRELKDGLVGSREGVALLSEEDI
jgi:hypothetical protein